MRITVVGSGHNALSVAAVLSLKNEVKILREQEHTAYPAYGKYR